MDLPVPAQIDLPDEDATLAWGGNLAVQAELPLQVHLVGELGAGKTTLSRGILRGLGHDGSVKSPTYTLVEPYTVGNHRVFHFDLYRLGDPGELAYIGIEDYFAEPALVLVEWAERGGDWLPAPDLRCHLAVVGSQRRLDLEPVSARGTDLVRRLLAGAPK